MKIGIIGSGNIGGSLGALWVQAGHQVMLSSRDENKIKKMVATVGAKAGTPLQAAQFGDVVLIAVPWPALKEALGGGVSEALRGKIVIDATNAYGAASIATSGFPSHSDAVAGAVPGSHVVKAYNMMQATVMADMAATHKSNHFAIYFSGDDAASKATVAQLITDSKFSPVDAGGLSEGFLFEAGKPLYDKQFSAAQALGALSEARHDH